VTKEHFEPVSKRDEKVKITSIASKDSVNFQYKKRDKATKTFTLKKGDSLSIINEAFEGITVQAISKSTVEFSNSIQKSTGEELDVDIFMTSYQEQMMRLALECHFETEKNEFLRTKFQN
jgi:type III restriction enzyme